MAGLSEQALAWLQDWKGLGWGRGVGSWFRSPWMSSCTSASTRHQLTSAAAPHRSPSGTPLCPSMRTSIFQSTNAGQLNALLSSFLTQPQLGSSCTLPRGPSIHCSQMTPFTSTLGHSSLSTPCHGSHLPPTKAVAWHCGPVGSSHSHASPFSLW